MRQRVGDEVAEDAIERVAVRGQPCIRCLVRHGQRLLATLGLGAEALDGRLDHLQAADRLEPQGWSGGAGHGEVIEVVEHASEAPGLVGDGHRQRGRRPHQWRCRHAGPGEATDDGEGCAQVVTDVRQQLSLGFTSGVRPQRPWR